MSISRLFTVLKNAEHSFLEDELERCPLSQVEGRTELLERELVEAGLQARNTVAFTCRSTVADCLLLLTLLKRGQGLVLLPPGNHDVRPIPQLCSHTLESVLREGAAHAGSFLLQPTQREGQPMPGRLLLRTSGSMGSSKLVVHWHDTLLQNAAACVDHYGYTAADRLLIPLPLAHMYGLGAGLLVALWAGASIALIENANLLRYLDRERSYRPTAALLTPSLCDMLLEGFRTPRTSYRLAVTSGQQMPESRFLAFNERIGGCLVNQYGSTELGAVAACRPNDPAELRARSLGVPLPGVALGLRPEAGGPIDPKLQEGELCCLHPSGYAGYMDETGVWLSQRTQDQWHFTGDRATLPPGGAGRILGRLGESINRRGYLIQLAELEALLGGSPLWSQVAVVHVPHAAFSERAPERFSREGWLVAFCVVSAEHVGSQDTLRAEFQRLLPGFAVPDMLNILPALPLLPSTKVDRMQLKALAFQQVEGTLAHA